MPCSSSVFVEGTIETRVYNDSITGQVRHIPEITVRREGTFNCLFFKKKIVYARVVLTYSPLECSFRQHVPFI